jgi:hypothetical protein
LTLHHFASYYAIDDHALHRYPLAGGRNAKELAAMCTMPREPAKYFLAFPHHLFDHPMNVGKRGPKRANHLLKTFASLLLSRKRVDFHEVNRHKVVRSLKSTFIDDFLNKTDYHRFILFCWHKNLVLFRNFGNSVKHAFG